MDQTTGFRFHAAAPCMPRLLAAELKIRCQAAIKEQDGFANRHTVFRAPEAEHVHATAPGQVSGAAVDAGAGVGKARAIHVQ